MTEREKIVDVLRDNCEYELRYYPDDNYTEVVIDYEAIADALIAAGVGDVSAVKAEQEEIGLFNAEIKNGEIDMTVGSEGFKTFFALIAQIFKQNGASAFLTTTIEGGNDIKYAVTIQRVGEKSPAEELRQATKLWKHEEHRAEVAERALLLMARGECTFAPPEFYKEEAEREVAKEEHIMANRCGEGKCEYFESIRRAANNNREYGYCKKYKQDLHLYDWWWLKCDECTAEKELEEEK